MGDFRFLGSGGVDGPEGHLPGLGPAVLPGPWVLVCRDVGGIDTGNSRGLQQLSGVELKGHGLVEQELHIDGLQLNGSVFQGLKLAPNRH